MECKDCGVEISSRFKKGKCRKCGRRDYDKKNKVKIRIQHQENYLENIEKRNQQSKDWAKNNREKYNKHHLEYHHKTKVERNIARETRAKYTHLRKDASCQICKGKEKIEFHHPRPYNIDVFFILCRECHIKLHSKLHEKFVKENKHYLFVKTKESVVKK